MLEPEERGTRGPRGKQAKYGFGKIWYYLFIIKYGIIDYTVFSSVITNPLLYTETVPTQRRVVQ